MQKKTKVIPAALNNHSQELIGRYISGFDHEFPQLAGCFPWDVPALLDAAIVRKISILNEEYILKDTTAIHRSAVIEKGAVLKGPLIIGPHCFIAAHAYIRGGVFLSERVSIGPGVEVKSSFIGANTGIAHFNFVGDSLIGSHVNLEAGAIIANFRNDRQDKTLHFSWSGQQHQSRYHKFGALVGDFTCIGANAVLSPGTILPAGTNIPRLALVDQQG